MTSTEATNLDNLILMATKDGMPYLPAQIKSLQQQVNSNWQLLVRDDGSTDGTFELLTKVASKDSRISIHPTSGQESGSARNNFCRLLESAADIPAKAIFLCDQDDIWWPSKLEIMAEKLSVSDELPTLVVSDLRIVAASGEPVGSTFWASHRAAALIETPSRLLEELCTRNIFPGCSMAFNRHLLQQILPLPEAAIMHDWWIALIAAVVGEIQIIGEPLLDYRQHTSNEIGETNLFALASSLAFSPSNWVKAKADFELTFKQVCAAKLATTRINTDLATENTLSKQQTLEWYLALRHLSPFGSVRSAWKSGVREVSTPLRLALLLHLFLMKRGSCKV